MLTRYGIYLRYKDMFELLNNQDCTAIDLANKLNISKSSIYRYIKELLDKKVIKAIGHKSDLGSFEHKVRLYRIVKK